MTLRLSSSVCSSGAFKVRSYHLVLSGILIVKIIVKKTAATKCFPSDLSKMDEPMDLAVPDLLLIIFPATT